jgi:hypothetical protein
MALAGLAAAAVLVLAMTLRFAQSSGDAVTGETAAPGTESSGADAAAPPDDAPANPASPPEANTPATQPPAPVATPTAAAPASTESDPPQPVPGVATTPRTPIGNPPAPVPDRRTSSINLPTVPVAPTAPPNERGREATNTPAPAPIVVGRETPRPNPPADETAKPTAAPALTPTIETPPPPAPTPAATRDPAATPPATRPETPAPVDPTPAARPAEEDAAVVARRADEAQLRGLVARFGQAYAAKDMGGLRSIWPGMRGADSSSYENVFRSYERLTWNTGSTDVELTGAKAVIRSSVTVAQQRLRERQMTTQTRVYRFQAERRAGGWVLVGVENLGARE